METHYICNKFNNENTTGMIETHIHLSHRYFEQTFPYIALSDDGYEIRHGDRKMLLHSMQEAGIEACIEPAIDVESNEKIFALSREYEGYLYPAVGNHPTRCIHSSVGDFRKIREFIKDKHVIAVGETGLDYHHPGNQHRLKQKYWFTRLINLANQHKLPLILHIRQAEDDAVRILRKNKGKLHGGVCHCFGGGPELAKIYTREFGLCLGIGGTLLMEAEISSDLKAAVKDTDIRYLLLETDGPYVKPAKPAEFSGKQWQKARNTSLILEAVAEEIARIKGMKTDDVKAITSDNARRVFGLPE